MGCSFAAFFTIVTAVFAAVISFLQYFIGRQKFRHDLYDRRFSIYEKTIVIFNELSKSKEHLESIEFINCFREFNIAVRESQFLFDDRSGIYKILSILLDDAVHIQGFRTKSNELKSDPETFIKEFQLTQSKHLNFFKTHLVDLEASLKPYLEFHKFSICFEVKRYLTNHF